MKKLFYLFVVVCVAVLSCSVGYFYGRHIEHVRFYLTIDGKDQGGMGFHSTHEAIQYFSGSGDFWILKTDEPKQVSKIVFRSVPK
ncbi:MAG: hypothetical protein WC373_16380 [Smithella sp.]|jgi:hypothetical protein